MTTVSIEQNIPIPPNVGRHRGKRWPFEHMDVGDSFSVDTPKQLTAARQAGYTYRKKHPHFRFASTQYPDGSGRLWRTE